MKFLYIVLCILMFAVATSFIYIWGLKKSGNQKQELMERLLLKGQKKVIKALKNRPMSYAELKAILEGTKVRLFYSRKMAQVQDADLFAKTLLDAMIDKHIINEKYKEKCHYYML